MTHKVRMLLGAVLLTLALLGTGLAAVSTPPVETSGGLPGENGG